jgi:hypothetical protein
MCLRLLLTTGDRLLKAAAPEGRLSPTTPAGVAAMGAFAILFVDHVQGSCTSLPDLIWDLDYPGSGAYDGPAARELSRRYTSGLALLDSRSPGTDGVELDGRLKQVQPGTAGVRETGFTAEAAVRAATQGNIRHVMPCRSISAARSRPSRRWPGSRDTPAQKLARKPSRAHRRAAGP